MATTTSVEEKLSSDDVDKDTDENASDIVDNEEGNEIESESSPMKEEFGSSEDVNGDESGLDDEAFEPKVKSEVSEDEEAKNCVADEEKKDEVENLVKIVEEEPPPPDMPKKRGRKRRGYIYDKDEDPESLKLKRKKRAVELKLKNLRWTLNQTAVSGKRPKKAPERFELAMLSRRKSSIDEGDGDGDPLSTIPWIVQHVNDADIYTLRLLHRVIFRKQGMFSEKHIRRSVLNFRGFPFDFSSPEVEKRKLPLEKATPGSLSRLCRMLGVKATEREEMMNGILKFLQRPTVGKIEEYLKELAKNPLLRDIQDIAQYQVPVMSSMSTVPPTSMQDAVRNLNYITTTPVKLMKMSMDESNNSSMTDVSCELYSADDAGVVNSPWKRPAFFIEGTGIKLKFFKPIVANIQVATNTFIELLHRLLFLHPDEKQNMRRNILEFSGFRSRVGTEEYFCRVKLLSVLPLDQIKYICRVLYLPTWHKSRQLLIDAIMNFLAFPSLSAMKKTASAPVNDRGLSTALDLYKKLQSSELEIRPVNVKTEEIEITPDIHLPDAEDGGMHFSEKGNYFQYSSEHEVKLKNFPNIHYQVISTPAARLNDVHMILYFRPCPLNVIRKNILEFTKFPFDDSSSEYHCRRALLEKMSIDSIKTVVTVLCLKQYAVDQSKHKIVEAVLKFLLKPSAFLNSNAHSLLSSSTSSSAAVLRRDSSTIQTVPFSKNFSLANLLNERRAHDDKITLEFPCSTGEITIQPINPSPAVKVEPRAPSPVLIRPTPPPPAPPPPAKVVPQVKDGANRRKSQQPVKIPANAQYIDVPDIKMAIGVDLDEPLATVQKEVGSVPVNDKYVDSDEDDDEPLSKFIGHPNDDQLHALITKIVKESKLEDITMKYVIKTVFNAYPNFDLTYRKEFIKYVVRQILSQMDEQPCSVSTTVLTF